MKEKKTDSFNIFDQTNNSFKMLRRTCDSLFRELRQEGVGSSSKSTEPITKDDEQLLWSSGQLDPSKILCYKVELSIETSKYHKS